MRPANYIEREGGNSKEKELIIKPDDEEFNGIAQ